MVKTMYDKELPLQEVEQDIYREKQEKDIIEKGIISSLILDNDFLEEQDSNNEQKPIIH